TPMKLRLKALDAKAAQEGILLTEAQIAALEKAKADKEAHGEVRKRVPGVLRGLGSPNTMKSGLIRVAGASARRRCKPSLTRFPWRRRNSWRHEHARQLQRLNSQHRLSDQVSANTH